MHSIFFFTESFYIIKDTSFPNIPELLYKTKQKIAMGKFPNSAKKQKTLCQCTKITCLKAALREILGL